MFTATGNVDVVFTVEINENGEILTFSKPGVVAINDVTPMHRFIDWIWLYKWVLVLCAVLLILFFTCLSVYSAKKAKSADSEKTEESEAEKIEDSEEENNSDAIKADALEESGNAEELEETDQKDEI